MSVALRFLKIAPVIALFIGFLPGASIGSGEASNEAAGQQLQEALSSVKTFTAAFDQTVTGPKGKILQSLKGRLELEKPSRFYWETLDPYPQVVASNGETLWVYDPDLLQVRIQDSAGAQSLPAVILSGQMQEINKQFDVSVSSQNDSQAFLFTPKAQGQDFESVTLVMKSAKLQSLRLQDSLGQTTDLVFKDAKRNITIDQDRFELNVPSDVDIIDERAVATP